MSRDRAILFKAFFTYVMYDPFCNTVLLSGLYIVLTWLINLSTCMYIVQVRSAYFLLLARYVPNVAKSIWDQCKKKYILRTDRPATDQRPTDLSRLSLGEISNGHISARGRPIHFMFGSTLGFSRSADRMALFPVSPNSIGIWEKTMREE